MAATAATLAVAGGAILGLAAPASAHNYLVSSTPKVGGTLTELPDRFDITTNDRLLAIGGSDSGFAFRVIGPDGRYHEDGCVSVDGPSMTTKAALGDSGKYEVEWQIVSADGHTVSDRYDFTWKAPAGFTPDRGTATPATCADGSGGGSASSAPDAPTGASGDSSATDALFIGAGGIVLAGVVVAVLLLLRRRPAAPATDDRDED
ncbi:MULTISPECIES: copper resistance CopC family protein [unclassified Curtobacterium]|uniref:copper resistance CopC family protein n=1 Tax=unclassified Curtobacterium TaxID=257496 RepID=UPI002783F525|nr:copper resistance CopC family protein [Curtobacterium sp. 260]MDP9735840.1 methionine-rich copper-binding protein CopC [Curtobacterium sp. 260]